MPPEIPSLLSLHHMDVQILQVLHGRSKFTSAAHTHGRSNFASAAHTHGRSNFESTVHTVQILKSTVHNMHGHSNFESAAHKYALTFKF